MNDQYQPQPAVNQTNALGLTGFIISLVSLLTCGGILSPISLILCLIALAKPPKGFAIAGLVLSIIGSLWLFVLFFVIGIGVVFAALGLGIAAAAAAIAGQVGQNAFVIGDAVGDYNDENGRVPASLVELDLEPSELTDKWGNRFVYLASDDQGAFMLVSAGPDGAYGNTDDYLGRVRLDGGFDFNIGQGYTDLASEGWGDVNARVIAESEALPAPAPEEEAGTPADPDATEAEPQQ